MLDNKQITKEKDLKLKKNAMKEAQKIKNANGISISELEIVDNSLHVLKKLDSQKKI